MKQGIELPTIPKNVDIFSILKAIQDSKDFDASVYEPIVWKSLILQYFPYIKEEKIKSYAEDALPILFIGEYNKIKKKFSAIAFLLIPYIFDFLEGNVEKVKKLPDAIDFGYPFAILNGHFNLLIEASNSAKIVAFNMAAEVGYTKVIDRLLEEPLSLTPWSKKLILFSAVAEGNPENFKKILNAFDLSEEIQCELFYKMCVENKLLLIDVFLEKYPDLSDEVLGAIFLAPPQNISPQVLQKILTYRMLPLRYINNILPHIYKDEYAEVVNIILNSKLGVNNIDWPAMLFQSCVYGHFVNIKQLLAQGSNIYGASVLNSMLLAAVYYRDLEVYEMLLQKYADNLESELVKFLGKAVEENNDAVTILTKLVENYALLDQNIQNMIAALTIIANNNVLLEEIGRKFPWADSAREDAIDALFSISVVEKNISAFEKLVYYTENLHTMHVSRAACAAAKKGFLEAVEFLLNDWSSKKRLKDVRPLLSQMFFEAALAGYRDIVIKMYQHVDSYDRAAQITNAINVAGYDFQVELVEFLYSLRDRILKERHTEKMRITYTPGFALKSQSNHSNKQTEIDCDDFKSRLKLG